MELADQEKAFNDFNAAIFSVVAIDNTSSPKMIGTGFVISAQGKNALAVTAAHNLSGILDAQREIRARHESALPEFIPGFETLLVNLDKTFVVASSSSGPFLSKIAWLSVNFKTDVALLGLESEDPNGNFEKELLIGGPPEIGGEVHLAGYAEMSVKPTGTPTTEYSEHGMSRTLTVRSGVVTMHHPGGHILCRGPCLETSIPVFSGMSGGPVFTTEKEHGKAVAFGIISSDQESDGPTKNDTNITGSTIAAIIDANISDPGGGVRNVTIRQANVLFQKK